jgi:hypothetical protein
MDQNQELLQLSRDQANSAALSARVLSESSRPYVVPQIEGPIWVGLVRNLWTVTFSLWNHGSSIAILEMGTREPKLLLARDGDHVAFGKANSVIVPKETGINLSFSIDPSEVARAGGPVTRKDGSYIAASLDYWYTDSARQAHYSVHAEFDAEDDPDGRFVTLLRLTNVEFGPPTFFGSATVTTKVH